MRGMPQAENGGKMRRGSREFTGTSGIIGFVPVTALVAKALARTRPLQLAPRLVRALCNAAVGKAAILPAMPLVRWTEKPNPGT